MSGPTEFGSLPLSDQLFWLGWIDQQLRETNDAAEEWKQRLKKAERQQQQF